MTQPGLFTEPPLPSARPKKRGHVRATSIAQYADGRERFTGRKSDVLRWLAHYVNARTEYPTSAELADLVSNFTLEWRRGDTLLLYVRRGLSDLQTAGVVEANGARTCRVSKRRVETWRIIPVGR